MRRLVKRLFPWVGTAGLLYVVVFAAASLRSQERTLGFGQPKRFCGLYLDCHRMVAVTGVTRIDRIGDDAPHGVYWIVTVQYRGDAYGADMRMDGFAARVQTADGQWHDRDGSAEERLAADGHATGLPAVTLASGNHFDTRLVFDLPAAADPRLYIRDSFIASRLTEILLIGDEDSFQHRRTFFALTPDAPTATIGDLSLSVLAVERDTATGAPYPVPADGVFYTVTVTLGGSGGWDAHLLDASGRRYNRATDVERLLPHAVNGTHALVFDVPDRTSAPILEIRPRGTLRRGVRIPLT